MPDQPGVSHRIFSAIAEQNIVVDMIAQNVGSDGQAAIGFTVPAQRAAGDAGACCGRWPPSWARRVEHDEDVSKVSIVGTGMRTHTGVAERMFAALAAENVNMKMITTGDIKISVLVDKADGVRALRAVHQAFRLHEPRPGAGLPAPGTSGSPLPSRPIDDEASGRDLAARIAAAVEHGGHRRQRRAAEHRPGPDHRSSTCRTGRATARRSSRRWRPAASSWT